MTTDKIQTLVKRCIEIDRLVADLTEEQKGLKAKLISQAKRDKALHTPTKSGGWSCSYADVVGNIARVSQPIAKMTSELDPLAPSFEKIERLAGEHFNTLFYQPYCPVRDVRKLAVNLLTAPKAKRLLKLITTPNAPKVEFEVKKGAA